jgi:hypothetical protein
LATTKVASSEALREVQPSPLFEVLGQRFQDAREHALSYPLLESAVAAGLVGRVAFGEVVPGWHGAQDPEDAV